MKSKNCKTCAFQDGNDVNGCKVLREKIRVNCFAYANESEAKAREKACQDYSVAHQGNIANEKRKPDSRKKNKAERGGLKAKEILDLKFMYLYNQRFHDVAIAEMLKVAQGSVFQYRKNLKLKPHKKSGRPSHRNDQKSI